MFAAFGGHVEAVALLVEEFGADVSLCNGWGCDITHWAAMGGSLDICRWLAANCGEGSAKPLDFTREQSEGHTALHKAAMKGKIDICRWLCDDGGLAFEELERIRVLHSSLAEEAADASGRRGGLKRLLAHRPSMLARKAGHMESASFLEERGV
eukprot:gnl/TRDRNA2_/TRDRNA2_177679_c2_seq1.p1 gnl/TRDRNA2_/TRDRNA2_177679_c2~~gnl/TRDRNA2_/TRDRNA2_177679_c2_seq1.p1  ORF type:complete len:154 (+),score=33.00 gnl/TRDRNA2_/TRDRNA2_177679_c2_seq1:145-606(+)